MKSKKLDFLNLARSSLAVTSARLAARIENNKEEYILLALQQAEKVITDRTATKETQSNAFLAKGFVYQTMKEYSLAITSFNEGISKYPENISCLIGLGDVYLKTGQIDKAEDAFRRAETLSPSSGYPSFKLGNIYREQGKTEQAREAYLRAPEFALAHVALGKIHLLDQEYSKALDEFRIAAQQNKRLSEAWVNIAWTICEMKTGDSDLLKEAESSARRVLQLEQNPAQLWHRHAVLARVLLLRGKNEASFQEALKAVEVGTDRAQAYYYLAEAEYSLGQYSRTRASLKKVLELKGEEWHVAAEKLLRQISEKE